MLLIGAEVQSLQRYSNLFCLAYNVLVASSKQNRLREFSKKPLNAFS